MSQHQQEPIQSDPDPEPSGRNLDIQNLVRELDDTDPAVIHLLCIRPPGDFERFDARLAILAARYADVRITFVAAARAAHAILPSVVLVRRGEIVGEAIGDLPLRELDEVVRCAATWPSAAATAA